METTTTAALRPSMNAHCEGLPDFCGWMRSTLLAAIALMSSGAITSQALGGAARAVAGRAARARAAKAFFMVFLADCGRCALCQQPPGHQDRQDRHHQQPPREVWRSLRGVGFRRRKSRRESLEELLRHFGRDAVDEARPDLRELAADLRARGVRERRLTSRRRRQLDARLAVGEPRRS